MSCYINMERQINISKYIINDRVNKNGIDEYYNEFIKYSNIDNIDLKNKYLEIKNICSY